MLKTRSSFQLHEIFNWVLCCTGLADLQSPRCLGLIDDHQTNERMGPARCGFAMAPQNIKARLLVLLRRSEKAIENSG